MLEVEKWGQGKSLFIALFAPQTAATARQMHEALQHIRERRVYGHEFPLPDFTAWFAMYRSPRKAVRAFRGLITEFSDFGKDLVPFGLAARQLQKIQKHNPEKLLELKPSPEQLKEAHTVLKGMLSNSFSELKESFSDTRLNTDERFKFLDFSAKNELGLGFSFLVFIPCWLLYQVSPTKLYKDAQRGDVDALVKLLRLDPLLLHDPSIGRMIQETRLKPNTNDYERILDAAREPLKINQKKTKASFAALISMISKGINQPLTEPQIRSLQDAVSQDAEGTPIDTDLPDSPEAFSRSILRHKPKWDKLLKPDKTK